MKREQRQENWASLLDPAVKQYARHFTSCPLRSIGMKWAWFTFIKSMKLLSEGQQAQIYVNTLRGKIHWKNMFYFLFYLLLCYCNNGGSFWDILLILSCDNKYCGGPSSFTKRIYFILFTALDNCTSLTKHRKNRKVKSVVDRPR